VYLDETGSRLPDEDVERVRGLVIPPAWEDVWICPWPNGHLQAVGTDDAGRRQYLYHPDWRTQRDAAKHVRVLQLGRVLSKARERVLTDLGTSGMSREHACATAVRLLDLGYFRIGNDVYADQYGSFGLTTLQRRHVRKRGESLVFRFVGKSGIEHEVTIDDPETVRALETMRKRRAPADARLLAWRERGRWHDLDATHVNEYVRDATGMETTAKDFRTWHATVIAAAALAGSEEPGTSRASRKRAVAAAMREVAEFLGNSPALARSSYVDPRVVDAYEEGRTIEHAVRRTAASPDERQAILERAVLRLLQDT
jgi:DNA topoisomerase IB